MLLYRTLLENPYCLVSLHFKQQIHSQYTIIDWTYIKDIFKTNDIERKTVVSRSDLKYFQL